MNAQARTFINIPLAFSIPVARAEGKTAEISQLTMKRPKTRHAIRLTAALGADLVRVLGDASSAEDAKAMSNADKLAFVGRLAELLTLDRLEAVQQIVADMCGEMPETIGELDLVDLVAVGAAFVDFFPQLLSLAARTSPPT